MADTNRTTGFYTGERLYNIVCDHLNPPRPQLDGLQVNWARVETDFLASLTEADLIDMWIDRQIGKDFPNGFGQ